MFDYYNVFLVPGLLSPSFMVLDCRYPSVLLQMNVTFPALYGPLIFCSGRTVSRRHHADPPAGCQARVLRTYQQRNM